MRKMEIKIDDLADIVSAARQFVSSMGQHRVFAFYGGMGAGKTTFIKAICREMGVADDVTSPTFAIVNAYEDQSGRPVYHFDLYRVKRIDEVYDMGYEDYIYSGAVCMIEWPDVAESLLPPDTVRVDMEVHPDGKRTVRMHV